jgi:hypothetical protein
MATCGVGVSRLWVAWAVTAQCETYGLGEMRGVVRKDHSAL